MQYRDAREMVALLFRHRPEKVQEFLARCCGKDDEIAAEVNDEYWRLRQLPPAGTELAAPFASVSPSLHESHHSGSHLHQHEIPPRPSEYPISPPRTVRSEATHSTKGEAGHKEYIYLLRSLGDAVQDQTVRMRHAPIEHSVIRQGLISESELDANVVPAEKREVHIPLDVHAGTVTAVTPLCAVKLTWRRQKSDMTHNTTFYVVSDPRLDIDMLLGYLDSGEDYPHTVVPPPQSHEARHFQGYNQELRPSAPTPPPVSYHRSAETNNGSLRTVSAHHPAHHDNQHFHTPGILDTIMPGSLGPGRSIETHRYSHHQASTTSFGLQPTQFEIPQPNPYRATVTTVASASSVSELQPDIRSDKLRIAIKWDETRFNMWLYPDAPSETFFGAFQSQVRKHKKFYDRTMMTIVLKEDEEASDEKSFTMPLGEDDLDADWMDIVKWVEKNKKKESPHIFGKVQVMDP